MNNLHRDPSGGINLLYGKQLKRKKLHFAKLATIVAALTVAGYAGTLIAERSVVVVEGPTKLVVKNPKQAANSNSNARDGQVLDRSTTVKDLQPNDANQITVHVQGQDTQPINEDYIDRLIRFNIVEAINQGWLNGFSSSGSRGTARSGGPVNLGIGETLRGGTSGSILFVGSGSNLQQDNDNFFWDDSANRLGLGTNTPAVTLEVVGSGAFSGDLDITGTTTAAGQLIATRAPSSGHVFSPWPSGTTNVSDSTLYINPASSVGDGNLIGAAVNGVAKFVVDAEGDIYGSNLILTGSTSSGSTTIGGDLVVQDNTDLGDSISDTVTFNALVDSNITPFTDDTYDLGAFDKRWRTLHAGTGGVIVHDDATDTNKVSLNFSGGTARLLTDAATPLKITTGANTGLNIDTAGNVGIGTASPTNLLTLSKNGGNAIEIDDTSQGVDQKIWAISNVSAQLELIPYNDALSGFCTNVITFSRTAQLDLGSGSCSNLNRLDVPGGVAVGSYSGVDTAPSNGIIVSGNVGIGTATPSGTFEVSNTSTATSGASYNIVNTFVANPGGTSSAGYNGLNNVVTLNGGDNQTNGIVGIYNQVTSNNTYDGTPTSILGQRSLAANNSSGTANLTGLEALVANAGAGEVTDAISLWSSGIQNQNASGTITNAYGLKIAAPTDTTGVITNAFGAAISEQSGATNNTNLVLGTNPVSGNYSIYSSSTYDSYFAGKIGIGDTDPTEATLVVGASGAGNIYATFATANSERLCWDASGASLITDCTGTPGDYAEEYGSDGTLSAGHVVAVDPAHQAVELEKAGEEGSKAWVKRASGPYQSTILGIVSTNPNEVIGQNFTPNEHPVPIALNGRVPVKVTNENGNIHPGDYLTTSATWPGYAMKATRSGAVIGQALQEFSSSDPDAYGNILVFVNIGWYTPKVSDLLQDTHQTILNSHDMSSLNLTNAGVFGEIVVTGKVYVQEDLLVKGVIYVAEIQVDTIKVKEQLCIGETCVTESQLKALLQQANGPGSNSPTPTPDSGDSGQVAGDSDPPPTPTTTPTPLVGIPPDTPQSTP